MCLCRSAVLLHTEYRNSDCITELFWLCHGTTFFTLHPAVSFFQIEAMIHVSTYGAFYIILFHRLTLLKVTSSWSHDLELPDRSVCWPGSSYPDKPPGSYTQEQLYWIPYQSLHNASACSHCSHPVQPRLKCYNKVVTEVANKIY